MIAVMPKYNPFAEKAGMHKVFVKEPPKAATNVTAELEKLGFDARFLGSQRYVRSKLESLSKKQLTEIRTAFFQNGHPMFREKVGAVRYKNRGKTKNYRKEIKKADIDTLAILIRITGILLQTKVYLFWENPRLNNSIISLQF
jgi:uncharacterized Zn finger protein